MQNHTADSIKSLEGFDICWCEESQSLSQRSLDLLRPTIRKPNSEMWFSWNPDQPTDPIDVLLRPRLEDGTSDPKNLPTDAVVVRVNYMDNPWFPDVLKDEMEFDRRRDPDKHAHVWLGEYQQNSEARVFHNWTVEEFDAPTDALHRLGIDFGFSVDPATMLRCHIIGRDLFIDYEAYRVGCEINDLPDLFSKVPGWSKHPCSADSARPDLISYLRKHGMPRIFGATKGKNSVHQGVIFLQGYDIHVHPRCRHTADEFSRYSWKVDPNTGLVTNVLEDKKNHIIDPLRYATERHRRLEPLQNRQSAEPLPTTNRWSRDDRRLT
jgi:phage terminase large subunit